MRKIILSAVILMLFGMFSGSVLAGKVEVCEEIKKDPAYKGLYGLCNAYWNADEKGQEKILQNWEKKAGPDGPPMPGLEPEVSCPCWNADVLNYPVKFSWLPLDSQVAGNFAIALYEFGTVQYFVDLNFCAYVNQIGGLEAEIALSTTDEEDAVCVQDMVDLIARDF